MLALRFLTLISCSMLCVVSCAQNKPVKQTKAVVLDKLVGRVSAVYPKSQYMLIQKYRTFSTDIDAIFYSRGADGTISPVKMTEQRLGQFYVADIETGNHAINDPVFMRDLRNSSEVDANKQDTHSAITSE